MTFTARISCVDRGRSWRSFAALTLLAAALSSCAQPPQQHARRNTKEYFAESKYGAASPRVVADGEPVPHGGGQYLIGHPYTIAGHTYYPGENDSYSAIGMASWYGDAFHGRRTANGEIYDMRSFTAAHPTMPLPSYARVTNLANGYSIIVRVNDRGPYHGGRVMDVSSRVADVLDFKGAGTAKVKVEYMGRAPLEGSDDATLLASLRTDGSPAGIDGVQEGSSMVAAAEPATPPILSALFKPAPPSPPPAPVAPIAAAPSPAAPEPLEAPALASAIPHANLINAPAPPPRPFDLGEIARTIAAAPAMPPRLPLQQASAGERALYFAASDSPALRLLRRSGPFDKVIPSRDAALSAGLSAGDR